MPRLTCAIIAAVTGLLFGGPGSAAAADTKAPFRYTSAAGVRFEVTADGLSRIALGDRVVATGGWYAWDAGPHWFARGSKDSVLAHGGYSKSLYAQAANAWTSKHVEALAPDHVRVRHERDRAVAVFEYRFSGEDVVIDMRIENHQPVAPVIYPAFGGLRFSFGAEPRGLLNVWHMSYLRNVQSGVFHPSHLNKIGGSYAAGGALGVGLAPVLNGLERSLFFWDYDMWNPDSVERRANRWLTYLRPDAVPARGARTFSMVLRVSPDTDWKHLLEPYRRQFRTAFGEQRYVTDFRCMAVAHVNRNPEAIGPANPYGFHGGFRRLDNAESVHELCDLLIPAMQTANANGLIFWGQGGQEPRGQMYRADFDILPPEVDANWSILVERFQAAGLQLGVTTRPGHMHVRRDWETDLTLDINPDDPRHLAVLGDRFQNMIDRGCTLFYLDSFGSSAGDVRIMRALRERLGPDIQTFAEHACDVMAVYSAFYSETDFWAQGSADWATKDAWRPRTGLRFLEIVNWLVGPVPCISRGYDVHGTIPEGFEPLNEFFYRHGLSPMIEDYQLPKRAAAVRAVQDRYVTEDGKRKHASSNGT